MAMNRSLSTTDVEGLGHEDKLSKLVMQRNKRLREEDLPTEFVKFKEEIKDLITTLVAPQTAQFREIKGELQSIKDTNANIDSSILLLTNQIKELCKKVETLEVQAKSDREYVKVLEQQVEDLQRTLRKTSIEIKNVPKIQEEKREDLIKMVLNLSNSIDLNMKPDDIKDVFRLQGKDRNVKNTPIIVELGCTLQKTDLLQKEKVFNIKNKTKLQAKHLGFKINEDTPIFISEQLTPKGARLFFLARDLVRSKKFKYCWTSFGRVFVRQDDNTRIIKIISESQINQLMKDA